MTRYSGAVGAAILAATTMALGCTQAPAPPAAAAAKPAAAKEKDHGHSHDHGDHHVHGAGPHDGTLADWGGGKYHVEFTVDHDKKETIVYVLGSDEKTPASVKMADGKLLLTISEPAFQVELAARPLPGESDGRASCYGGTHESLGIVREFAGTISGEVDGTPFAGDFAEQPHGDHDHE
jgi:hypothetical protein